MRKRPSLVNMQKVAAAEPSQSPITSPSNPFFPLLAALYYIITSAALTLFNKLLFSVFPAADPTVLLLCQAITAVSILTVLRALNKFTPPALSQWTRASIRIYAPLYISNLAMLLTSLIALKYTSLLMYNTLRRTSMIFVVAIHCGLHRVRPTSYTIGATLLVTVGALIASSTDLAYDPLGYALALTANLSTAVYLVFLRPVRDKLQVTNLQLLYVNALASIPVLLILTASFPPRDSLFNLLPNPTFAFLFLCSCSLALVINHAIFVNTTTNDAIAQSISSQLKDVLLLIISVVFVDDASQRASGNLQGVFVGFLGSLVYGVGKLLDRRAVKDEEPKSSPDSKEQDSEQVGIVHSDVKINT